METKQQIIYRLLFEQKITPEQAEIIMQEPQWKYDPNTWLVQPDNIATPSYPNYPTYDINGMYQCYFDTEKQAWIVTN